MPRVQDIETVEIPAEDWQCVGDSCGGPPKARLLATLVVNGCWLHVEALQVTDRDGMQEATHSCNEERFEEMQGVDPGRWATVTIGRREYVIVASPFQD